MSDLPIQVISLGTASDRRKEFARNNPHLSYAFVDAIDGRMQSEASIRATGLFGERLPFSPGACGCAMSHLKLWETAISTEQVVTVAEDDAIFRLDFEERSRQLLGELPENWDFVLWGWNFDSFLSLRVLPGISPAVVFFNQDQLRKATAEFQQLRDRTTPMRLEHVFGIPAYSISPRGARKFKSRCFPVPARDLDLPLFGKRLPNTGIDITMNFVYRESEAFCCFPPLVVSKNDHASSSIQTPQSR